MQLTSLSVALLTITSVLYFQSSAEQVCKLKNGRGGVCTPIRNCPAARDLLRARMSPQLCGYNRFQPIVCCAPSNEAQRSEERIAQKKCLEYKTTTALRREKRGGSRPFVTGGESANPFDFRHMAVLGYEDVSETKWNCGGSLISEKFVLTAAHCINTKLGPVQHVALGVYNLRHVNWDADVEKFTVKTTHIYPEYDRRKRYHDVALIELDRAAKMTARIQPACLYYKRQLPEENLIVTGWGALYDGGFSAKLLQQASLVSVPYKVCRRSFQRARRLPEGLKDDFQICASGSKRHKNGDACQGDSGGPLQVPVGNQYTIVGITSFGIKCGILPGVYTRVSNYVPWIESIVWPS